MIQYALYDQALVMLSLGLCSFMIILSHCIWYIRHSMRPVCVKICMSYLGVQLPQAGLKSNFHWQSSECISVDKVLLTLVWAEDDFIPRLSQRMMTTEGQTQFIMISLFYLFCQVQFLLISVSSSSAPVAYGTLQCVECMSTRGPFFLFHKLLNG